MEEHGGARTYTELKRVPLSYHVTSSHNAFHNPISELDDCACACACVCVFTPSTSTSPSPAPAPRNACPADNA